MRRLLKNILEGICLGDVSTLEDESSLEESLMPAEQEAVLEAYAKHMSCIERKLFAQMVAGQDARKLKSEHIRKYGITARQFNACRMVVEEVASEFRKRKIPCDALWHDILYMDGFRCFTWDQEQFSDPQKHNAQLHKMGFKTVWIIDPGIKVEKGYFVFDQGSVEDA